MARNGNRGKEEKKREGRKSSSQQKKRDQGGGAPFTSLPFFLFFPSFVTSRRAARDALRRVECKHGLPTTTHLAPDRKERKNAERLDSAPFRARARNIRCNALSLYVRTRAESGIARPCL